MTKNMSWTGTHPAVDLWAEARQERDEWQARAEAAEKRIAALEAQIAAQGWRPMDGEDYPRDPNQKIQMIVNGYCGEREEWQTDIGQEIRAPYRCIRGWRPIDPPAHPTPSNSTGLAIGE